VKGLLLLHGAVSATIHKISATSSRSGVYDCLGPTLIGDVVKYNSNNSKSVYSLTIVT
jgi:hypothetical protein